MPPPPFQYNNNGDPLANDGRPRVPIAILQTHPPAKPLLSESESGSAMPVNHADPLRYLKYFIEEEKKDVRRRKQSWREDGQMHCRVPPTARGYFEDQERKGKLLPGARAGSYVAYVIESFGPKGQLSWKATTSQSPGMETPWQRLIRR
ncbi:MAG: hypothetical protein Q9180_008702 [Flavoplaca navasiana]